VGEVCLALPDHSIVHCVDPVVLFAACTVMLAAILATTLFCWRSSTEVWVTKHLQAATIIYNHVHMPMLAQADP
jgi:hypothetical protein